MGQPVRGLEVIEQRAGVQGGPFGAEEATKDGDQHRGDQRIIIWQMAKSRASRVRQPGFKSCPTLTSYAVLDNSLHLSEPLLTLLYITQIPTFSFYCFWLPIATSLGLSFHLLWLSLSLGSITGRA